MKRKRCFICKAVVMVTRKKGRIMIMPTCKHLPRSTS